MLKCNKQEFLESGLGKYVYCMGIACFTIQGKKLKDTVACLCVFVSFLKKFKCKMADKKSFEKLLRKIYYDPKRKGSFGSMRELLLVAKKENKAITSKHVKKFFQNELVPSPFGKPNRKFPRAHFIAGSAFSTLVGDMGDMTTELTKFNNKNRYINVVADLFSRCIVGLVPQVTKSSAETSVNLDAIFSSVPAGQTVFIFLTDQGTEYLGTCLLTYTMHKIEHQQTTGIEQKAQTFERSLKEIKGLLYKLMEAEKTNHWIDFLDMVKDHLYNKYNRVLKMTPLEATKLSNQSAVFLNAVLSKEADNFAALAERKQVYKYDVGDLVRIIRYDSHQKSYKGVWSENLFRITHRELKSYIPIYTLEEALTNEEIHGIWYEQELRKVNLSRLPEVDEIHGRRINLNREEVQVQLKGTKKKVWMPLSELIAY